MNCPKCGIRQLNQNLFCCDCGTKWSQKQLDFFKESDAIFTAEYREEIAKAEKNLREKRKCLLRRLKEV